MSSGFDPHRTIDIIQSSFLKGSCKKIIIVFSNFKGILTAGPSRVFRKSFEEGGYGKKTKPVG